MTESGNAALAELGVTASPAADGSVALRCARASGPAAERAALFGVEWLRLAFTAFGLRARLEGDALVVADDGEAFERVVQTALQPSAVLFDLDGVLADISARRRIAAPEDVAAIAASYRVGVVTTCPRRLADSVLERHGFADYVQVVVGSDDGPCKPDPFPVRHALQQLEAKTAWMLGDNPSDVVAARGGGALPLAVRPRGAFGGEQHADRLRSAGALRLLDGVGDLRQLLLTPRSG